MKNICKEGSLVNIINKPKINEDPKDALLKEYLDEIKKLKELLENQNGVPLGLICFKCQF